MRGKVFLPSCSLCLSGSPPHMRGKVVRFGVRAGALGITPAHAGKRRGTLSCAATVWDHPRMCGEKAYTDPARCKAAGSPPHVRGKVPGICEDLERVGITPACAGKRTAGQSLLCGQWDHPRMCGEKNCGSKLALRTMGSPPHVRGKDPVLHLRQCLQVRPDHARHLVHLSFLRA